MWDKTPHRLKNPTKCVHYIKEFNDFWKMNANYTRILCEKSHVDFNLWISYTV